MGCSWSFWKTILTTGKTIPTMAWRGYFLKTSLSIGQSFQQRGPSGFPKAGHWRCSGNLKTDLKGDWFRDYKGDRKRNKELLKW